MLLTPQPSMLAVVSDIGAKIDPISWVLLPFPVPSLASVYSSCPERVAKSASLREECSRRVNVSHQEPASQEGWVCKCFQKVEENWSRAGFATAASHSDRVGLLLGPLSLWCGLGLIELWHFYQLYFHWIPRSSQLTFHRRSAVLLFRALGDTQVLLQSLEGRERM